MGAELAPLPINPGELNSEQSFGGFMLEHSELLEMDLAVHPGVETAGDIPSDAMPDAGVQTPFGTEQSVDVPVGTTATRGRHCLVGGLWVSDPK